jgi:hypothetical protein
MFRLCFIFLFALLLLSGCQKEDSVKKEFTFEDFQRELKVGMDYSDIILKFGDPVKEIGSGLHIYVYELSDSSEVWIGYTNKIEYIKQVK